MVQKYLPLILVLVTLLGVALIAEGFLFNAAIARTELKLQQDLESRAAELTSALAHQNDRLQKQQQELNTLHHQIELLDRVVNKDERTKELHKLVITAIQAILPPNNPLPGCPSKPSIGTVFNVSRWIIQSSTEYGVPVSLMTALVRQESIFCNSARSPVGAIGFAQLMPATATDVTRMIYQKTKRVMTPQKARDNIELGAAYLAHMLITFNGNIEHAVRAYNGGPTHVKRVLADKTEEKKCLKSGFVTKYHCETEGYVRHVLNYREKLQELGVP